jgi:hypothetical protein
VTPDGVEELYSGDTGHTEVSDLVDLWKAKEVETLGALAPSAAVADASVAAEPELSLDEAEIDRA